jgi:hypothetical protein
MVSLGMSTLNYELRSAGASFHWQEKLGAALTSGRQVLNQGDLTGVLVRFDRVARFITNANHRIMRTAAVPSESKGD